MCAPRSSSVGLRAVREGCSSCATRACPLDSAHNSGVCCRQGRYIHSQVTRTGAQGRCPRWPLWCGRERKMSSAQQIAEVGGEGSLVPQWHGVKLDLCAAQPKFRCPRLVEGTDRRKRQAAPPASPRLWFKLLWVERKERPSAAKFIWKAWTLSPLGRRRAYALLLTGALARESAVLQDDPCPGLERTCTALPRSR